MSGDFYFGFFAGFIGTIFSIFGIKSLIVFFEVRLKKALEKKDLKKVVEKEKNE